MPLEVDGGLLDEMRRSSGAIQVEVRTADLDVAIRGLKQARDDIFSIPHPEQLDWPYAKFASKVEIGPRGAGFWFDMADAEVYDGLLEGVLLKVVTALEEAGLDDAVLTWPDSTAASRMGAQDVEVLRTTWQAFEAGLEEPDASIDTTQPGPGPRRPDSASRKGWTRCAPVPTSRGRLVACRGPEGWIYAIGGEGRRILKTVEAYDPRTDRWKKVAPLTIPRRGAGAALGPDGRIYAVGGYGSHQAGRTTVEAYDASTNRWEMVAPLTSDHSNDMTAATGPDGRIYAMAIGSWARPHILEAYDTVDDRWTPLAPPQGSYQSDASAHLVAAPDGRIYAFGALARAVEAYDPTSDTWQAVSPFVQPRLLCSVAVGGDGRIYAMGGYGPVATVEAYDCVADRWVDAEPMPAARMGMGLATGLDGAIYAIGGWGTPDANGHYVGFGPTDVFMP